MDTKNEISRAALKLFIEKGFTDVSVNEIITEIDLTKGGFYHYFKSKDDLIAFVFETYIFRFFYDTLSQVENEPCSARDKVKSLVNRITCYDEYLGSVLNCEYVDFNSFYLLLMEGLKKYGHVAQFYSEIQRRLKGLIVAALEDGKAQGLVPEAEDTHELALKIMAQNEGTIMLKMADTSIELKKSVRRSFCELLA